MVTRLYEWDKNETGWTWIEVTDNKVINLILRSLNNLIKVNDNNEVYVDLQLEDWIADDDTLPIWVNVGRVLAADGRPVTWTLISGQTTSGDRVKVLYGDDWDIYVDNGTGSFVLLQNVRAFYVSTLSDTTTAQAACNWRMSGKCAIVIFQRETFFFKNDQWNCLVFKKTEDTITLGASDTYQQNLLLKMNYHTTWTRKIIDSLDTEWDINCKFLSTDMDYSTPYMPQYDWSPATKKYVDNKVVIDSNAPATPQAWQFWYDTTNSTLSLYDGTQRLSI